MRTSGIVKRYIYCKNEGKVEEILKYFFECEIPFEIVGRQALFLPAIDGRELANFLSDEWFEVEPKDNLDEFPPHCWEFRKKGSIFPHGRTVPDTFSAVQIAKQEYRI